MCSFANHDSLCPGLSLSQDGSQILLAMFLRPAAADINLTMQILQLFGEASGLKTNVQKSSVAPISCSATDMEIIQGYGDNSGLSTLPSGRIPHQVPWPAPIAQEAH
jgi:hypothetical protein